MSTLIQASLFDVPRMIEPNPSVLPCDRRRLSSQCHKILAKLKDGPALGSELNEMGCQRFGARLGELRAAGCVISKRHAGGGAWEYSLDYCPDGLT